MIGTLLNALTVLIGGSLGTWLGHRFPTRMQQTIFAALGLFTLFIGFQSALQTGNALIPLGSLVIGALLGEWWDFDGRLERFGEWLKRRFVPQSEQVETGRFVEGFVTASLVSCVGPLTILGAVEDGLSGDYTKLAIKSVLDGFASIAFAATLGVGVLASILVILGFQGGLSLLAIWLGGSLFTGPMIAEMSAVGGIVLLSIGLRLLDLKAIRSANLLPALVIAPLVVAVLDWLQIVYRF